MLANTFSGFAVLLALSPAVQAVLCTYQEYICGSTLLDGPDGTGNTDYDVAALTAAYGANSRVPTLSDPITEDELRDVLFRCDDTDGGIVANSFCIVGCVPMGGNLDNDQCTL